MKTFNPDAVRAERLARTLEETERALAAVHRTHTLETNRARALLRALERVNPDAARAVMVEYAEIAADLGVTLRAIEMGSKKR